MLFPTMFGKLRYLIERLQSGGNPTDVVKELLERYLVKTTTQRVIAYRHYREQRSDYWTTEKMEIYHWEYLYTLVSLDVSLKRAWNQRLQTAVLRAITDLRIKFCEHLEVSEEFVPIDALSKFFFIHQAHARLHLEYPDATVHIDEVSRSTIETYRRTFEGEDLPGSAFECIGKDHSAAIMRSRLVATEHHKIIVPLAAAQANIIAAFATHKCQEIYASLTWIGSLLNLDQRAFRKKIPRLDFHFWVMYGSWSSCPDCGSLVFNDSYFKEQVYKNTATSSTSDLLAPYRRIVPTDPVEHQQGSVGVSSRWWYLNGMYKPEFHCNRCTRPPNLETAGAAFSKLLRGHADDKSIPKTGELYRIPRIRHFGSSWRSWSPECVTWPSFSHGRYIMDSSKACTDSFLHLTIEEARALQIIKLFTSTAKATFGAHHHQNFIKTGLSRAAYNPILMIESNMPTERCKAALRFLVENNRFYKYFREEQANVIRRGGSLNISSYDLFIQFKGVECAMFPVLYPTTDFNDTGILEHYHHHHDDLSNRVCSIGVSWTRKVLSSVRCYGENYQLAFFLYEKNIAQKYFHVFTLLIC